MLSLQVGQVPALKAGQVVLQSGVGVWVAVSKLVYIVLSVETEGEGHDIVAPVVRATVVVHVFGWEPLPATAKDKHIMETLERSITGQIFSFKDIKDWGCIRLRCEEHRVHSKFAREGKKVQKQKQVREERTEKSQY